MYTNHDQEIAYLLSLQAVRDRSRLVLQAAEEGALNSFDYDAKRMPEVADFVLGVISVSLPPVHARPCMARLPLGGKRGGLDVVECTDHPPI